MNPFTYELSNVDGISQRIRPRRDPTGEMSHVEIKVLLNRNTLQCHRSISNVQSGTLL